MPVSEIRSFLNERKVGIPAGIIERAELNELASEAHRKSSAVGNALQMRREEVTNRFALINTAYTTLSGKFPGTDSFFVKGRINTFHFIFVTLLYSRH